MFHERKTVYFQLPFCKTNERKIKSIVNKLEDLTNNKVKFIYHWKTRKLKSLIDKMIEQQCFSSLKSSKNISRLIQL